MAKKSKKDKNKETTIENYYDLKVDKVDELVSILKDEETEFDNEVSDNIADYAETEEEKKKAGSKKFDPYKIDKMSRVPTWVKALFVKIWSNGLICFLFVWGMQSYIEDRLDLMVLTGLMLGIINDLFVNTAFMHFQSDKREYDDYMMFPFPFKKFWTFFANIIYYIFVVFCVYFGFYYWFNRLVVTFGLEPITFGILTMLFDMGFIGIKDLIVHKVRKNRELKALAEGGTEADGISVQQGVNGNSAEERAEDDKSNSDGAKADEPSEELDDVERLRRLAEEQNSSSEEQSNAKNGKTKKKK